MSKKNKQKSLNSMIFNMIEEERDFITYDSVEKLFTSIFDTESDKPQN